MDVARLACDFTGDGVVGFGLDGDESRFPPALFADACGTVRAAGLVVVPHAGELLGPGSVVDAIDVLGARRVMHGVRCIEDPQLVARLADAGTVLDVCPTSNILLSVVPSWQEGLLPALLAAGVRCTVNADDPLLFDTDLLTEYRRCREQLGLTGPSACRRRPHLPGSLSGPRRSDRCSTRPDRCMAAQRRLAGVEVSAGSSGGCCAGA